MKKFESLKNGKNFRELISQNDKVKSSTKEFYDLKDRFNVSSASLNCIEDLIFLGFQYDDTYTVPDYQRNLVWTTKQKQSLILSVLNGNPIGDFLFGKESNHKEAIFHYRIIDGQQRLNALREFAVGDLSLPDGRYLKDLNYWDGRSFFQYDTFVAFAIKGISEEQEIELYLQRNDGGTTHTKKDIEKAKSFLN